MHCLHVVCGLLACFAVHMTDGISSLGYVTVESSEATKFRFQAMYASNQP